MRLTTATQSVACSSRRGRGGRARRVTSPMASLGFAPFGIGDAIKCALAAGMLPIAWRPVGHDR